MMMDESHAIKDNMAPFMFLIGSYVYLYICLDYPGRPLKAEIPMCPINLNYLFVWTKFIFNYLKKKESHSPVWPTARIAVALKIYIYVY